MRNRNVESQARDSGIGVLGLLGVLFVGLKLTGHIDWSWWWVTAPFWGPFALVIVILGGIALACAWKTLPQDRLWGAVSAILVIALFFWLNATRAY